jgi:cell division protein FtsB
MNVGLSIWDRLTQVVIVLLLIAAVAGVIIWYQPVIRDNENMRQRKLLLEKKIEQEKEIGRRLESQFQAMQDSRTIERLAREKLSYAKPGEIVIHFEQVTTNGFEK